MLNAFIIIIYLQPIFQATSSFYIDLVRNADKHFLIEFITKENKTFMIDYKQNNSSKELLFNNRDVFLSKIKIGSNNETFYLIPDFKKYITELPCGLSYFSKNSKSFNQTNLLFYANSTPLIAVLASDSIIISNVSMNLWFLNEENCYDIHESSPGYLGLSIENNDLTCLKNLQDNSTCKLEENYLVNNTFRMKLKENNFAYKIFNLFFDDEYNGKLNFLREINGCIDYNFCYSTSKSSMSSFWHCELSGLYLFGGDENKYEELKNTDVIFNPSIDHIRVPVNHYDFLSTQIKNCTKNMFPDGSMAVTCKNDFLIYKFLEFGFRINNYVYRINPLNIFWKTNEGFVLKILFTNEKEFVLGLPFLKQFDTVYDIVNHRVGINSNSIYTSSFLEFKERYLIIFLIIGGLIFLIMILALVISLRIKLKKNKTQILELNCEVKNKKEVLNNLADFSDDNVKNLVDNLNNSKLLSTF